LKLQEQLKAETHVSEAAFRSLKLAEDEFKSKLQQLEGVINNLKKQLEAKDGISQNNNEKQKQLQATIDVQTKTEEANKRTIEELREKEKQTQATIDGLTKTVGTMNEMVEFLCEHPRDVSTCEVETASTSKGTEIPPAVNIAK
jgi:chromosome segregation ATPase